ncbi:MULTISPECIES: hypothetical protein [unclassified Nonomuraea]|uniref:hypothetical protein n=1 Tax=unclassified Nonomuraea TaxID=2593643 RepID=UPI0033FDCB8C
MTTLTSDWVAELAAGWPQLRHLRHECGWRSFLAYDLTDDATGVHRILALHRCQGGDTRG